ncbi:MAG: DUF2007 domain-containing protein [bacterium]|nr:DUF2007 domain-containing protein [bacterium]
MPMWPAPGDVVVVHGAATEFEAIAIRDLLEAAGVHTMIRSRVVPGYGVPTMAGDQAGIVAEILVPPEHEGEARALIADYLAALEQDAPP